MRAVLLEQLSAKAASLTLRVGSIVAQWQGLQGSESRSSKVACRRRRPGFCCSRCRCNSNGRAGGFWGHSRHTCSAAPSKSFPDSENSDSDDDDGEIAYVLIERGVHYDSQRGFDLNDAVIAVESAGAADESDAAGCRAADVLALLHVDIAAGRRRSGRQLAQARGICSRTLRTDSPFC